jgi:glycosyltransferase involved in cell wall biosynthesis
MKSLYRALRRVLPLRLHRELHDTIAWMRSGSILLRLARAKAVARRRPHGPLVGWLMAGDRDTGSTRVRGLLPHAYLRRRGIASVVVAERLSMLSLRPRDMARIARARFDVVVFETVSGEGPEELAHALRAAGTRTVYAVGELRRTRMPEAVDRVVLASDSLWEMSDGWADRARVIEAPIEAPAGLCKDHARTRRDGRVRVVWVGARDNLHLLAPVRDALESPHLEDFELVTISSGPGVTHQWHRDRVWHQLLRCDIAVLPFDESDWYRTKPNTRMTTLKALGLPIVASPIPSYLATLTHGRGCYFARDVEEWRAALLALADPARRREMGLAEREEILERYSVEAIGARWLALLEEAAAAVPDTSPEPGCITSS